MRYHTRNSKGAEEQWDVIHSDDNSSMSANDRKFCKYIMAQLERKENKHFTEPFNNTFNLPAYQGFARHADLSTIKNDVANDFYGSLNEFKEDFQRIVNNCKAVEKDDEGLFYDKANDLQHHLVKLFEQKKSLYARWDKEREQEQSDSPSAVPGASSASAPGASSRSAGPVAAPHPPSPAPLPSTMQTLPHRFSATPTPSRRPTNDSEARVTDVQASNTRASRQSSRAKPDIISREVGETLHHDAELRQARAGKKRAASDEETITASKRTRQEAPKYKYTDLRVGAARIVNREMRLVHEHMSDIDPDEGAQRYVDHVSQMDAYTMNEAKEKDLEEIKESCIDEIEKFAVELIQKKINEGFARKGQHIQPRVSLPSLMKDAMEHEEIEDEDRGSETDSKGRIKRE
ncbi:hypothetical protein KCU99_g7011, partial [Aureobasidium melanogenum]